MLLRPALPDAGSKEPQWMFRLQGRGSGRTEQLLTYCARRSFAAIREEAREVTLARVTTNLARCAEDDSHLVLVAEAPGGVIAGYGAVHWLPYLILTGGEGYVSELFIGDDFRGQGIGGRLLDAITEEARQRGCARLMLLNIRDPRVVPAPVLRQTGLGRAHGRRQLCIPAYPSGLNPILGDASTSLLTNARGLLSSERIPETIPETIRPVSVSRRSLPHGTDQERYHPGCRTARMAWALRRFRVLNDKDDVSPETYQRVREVIAELGYIQPGGPQPAQPPHRRHRAHHARVGRLLLHPGHQGHQPGHHRARLLTCWPTPAAASGPRRPSANSTTSPSSTAASPTASFS